MNVVCIDQHVKEAAKSAGKFKKIKFCESTFSFSRIVQFYNTT